MIMDNEIRDRLARQAQERDEKRREFAAKYLPDIDPDGAGMQAVFAHAWEQGHASGWGEVEFAFSEFAEAMKAVIAELKEKHS